MAGKSFGVTVYITAWTSDDQVKDYVSVLKEKGPNGLVSAMEKASDVGRLSPAGFVGTLPLRPIQTNREWRRSTS